MLSGCSQETIDLGLLNNLSVSSAFKELDEIIDESHSLATTELSDQTKEKFRQSHDDILDTFLFNQTEAGVALKTNTVCVQVNATTSMFGALDHDVKVWFRKDDKIVDVSLVAYDNNSDDIDPLMWTFIEESDKKKIPCKSDEALVSDFDLNVGRKPEYKFHRKVTVKKVTGPRITMDDVKSRVSVIVDSFETLPE